jgi:hypothetical protein
VNIELHIERLILDGLQVERGERADLQASVEAELSRLLTSGGLRPELMSGVRMRSLAGGEMQLTNQTLPAHLGTDIAKAVHVGIGAEGPVSSTKGRQ